MDACVCVCINVYVCVSLFFYYFLLTFIFFSHGFDFERNLLARRGWILLLTGGLGAPLSAQASAREEFLRDGMYVLLLPLGLRVVVWGFLRDRVFVFCEIVVRLWAGDTLECSGHCLLFGVGFEVWVWAFEPG
jgi:hypothetical protein